MYSFIRNVWLHNPDSSADSDVSHPSIEAFQY